MKKYILLTWLCFCIFVSLYLIWPSVKFPNPPPESLQSFEPADTESPNRRAYFTNLNRTEVMAYYRQNFNIRALRLNHPPEEAPVLIRDQTRSSWLEELYLPLRDGFLINGFYPTKPTEQININNVHYDGKITVRYLPSHPVARLTVFSLAIISGYLLYREYVG